MLSLFIRIIVASSLGHTTHLAICSWPQEWFRVWASSCGASPKANEKGWLLPWHLCTIASVGMSCQSTIGACKVCTGLVELLGHTVTLFLNLMYVSVYLCLWVHMQIVCVLWYKCGGQKTASGSLLFLSTMGSNLGCQA